MNEQIPACHRLHLFVCACVSHWWNRKISLLIAVVELLQTWLQNFLGCSTFEATNRQFKRKDLANLTLSESVFFFFSAIQDSMSQIFHFRREAHRGFIYYLQIGRIGIINTEGLQIYNSILPLSIESRTPSVFSFLFRQLAKLNSLMCHC